MFKWILFTVAMLFGKPVEIWIMPNGANPEGVIKELLNSFKKETGNDYKLVILDWGEAWGRIHNALEKGEGPDVVQMGTTWVPYFASRGWLKDLTNQDIGDLSRFNPQTLESSHFFGSQNVYSLPWFIDLRVLFANRGLLNKFKIDPDSLKTWSSFRNVLKKINKAQEGVAEPVGGFGFPGKNDWNIPHNFSSWIWSEGGDFLTRDGDQWHSGLLKAETVRGIRRYIGLVLDSLASQETLNLNTASVSQRFNNGELVFITGTSEVLQQTRISSTDGGLSNSIIGKMGIEPLPFPAGSEGSVAFLGGSHLAIPQGHSNDPQALELLNFMTRHKNLEFYSERIGFIPSDRHSIQQWGDDPLYKQLIKSLPAARSYPNHPEWGSIEGTLVEMFSEIWSLVDVPGFYTDRELYEVLVRYDGVINQQLSYDKPTKIPTFQDFISFLDPADPTLKKTTSGLIGGHRNILWVGGIIFVLLLIIIWRRSSTK